MDAWSNGQQHVHLSMSGNGGTIKTIMWEETHMFGNTNEHIPRIERILNVNSEESSISYLCLRQKKRFCHPEKESLNI